MIMILLLALLHVFFSVIFAGKTESSEGSKEVANSAENICPLLVGQKISTVQLKTSDNKDFDLNGLIFFSPTKFLK